MGDPLILGMAGRFVGGHYRVYVETPKTEDETLVNGVRDAGTESVPADGARADSFSPPAQVNDVLCRLMHFASRSFHKAITREQIGRACLQLLKSERPVPNLLEEGSVQQPRKIDKKLKKTITSLANTAQDAADAATKAFRKIENLKGRDLAAAYALEKRKMVPDTQKKMVSDTHKVRKHVDAAIKKFADLSFAMAELEETLLANGQGESGAFGTIAALHQLADERLSELQTLVIEMTALAEADIDGKDPRKKVLNRKISDLLSGMSGTMHGNFEALQKEYEATLKTDANGKRVWDDFIDQANAFLVKGNVSLDEVRDFLSSAKEFGKVLRNIKTPDGSVLDKFRKRLSEIGDGIEDLFRDCRLKATAHRARQPLSIPRLLPMLNEFSKSEPGFKDSYPTLFAILEECRDCRRLFDKVAKKGLTGELKGQLDAAVEKMMGGQGLLNSQRIADAAFALERELDLLNQSNPKLMQQMWQKMGSTDPFDLSLLKTFVRRHLAKEAQCIDQKYCAICEIAAFGRFADEPDDGQGVRSTSFVRGNVLEFLFGNSDRTLGDVLESRMNGADDSMIAQTFRTRDIEHAEKLGEGGVNSVYKLTDKDKKVWVFKPEAPAQQGLHLLNLGGLKAYEKLQQAVKLNVATRRLAEVIGLEGLVPETHVVTYEGRYGMIMEMARGLDPSEHNSTAVIQKMTEIAERDPAKFEQLMDNLVEQLTDLQWLDLLTGQGDRHWLNYMVQLKDSGTAVVKGIDNDMSFPAYRTGLNTFELGKEDYDLFLKGMAKYYPKATPAQIDELAARFFTRNGDRQVVKMTPDLPVGIAQSLRGIYGLKSMAIPPCISQRLYEKIKALDEENIESLRQQLLECMPAANAEATVNRIREMKELVEREVERTPGFVVSRTEANPLPWVTGVSGRMMMTDFESSDEANMRKVKGADNRPIAGDFTLVCTNAEKDYYEDLFRNFFIRDFETHFKLLKDIRKKRMRRQ